MSTSSLASAPFFLWNLYIEHLWDYQPGSWVQRTASTFRVLAFFVITPFVILTLLDVASYVIARTLGVVDVTKASTGEFSTQESGNARERGEPPAIQVLAASPDASRTEREETETEAEAEDTPKAAASFFRDVEDGNLQLSGVDAFSPAPSQPPSPTLSRYDKLQPFTDLSGNIRRRGRSNTSGSNAVEPQPSVAADGNGSERQRGAPGAGATDLTD